ncbi:hypothetical protein SAMN05216228_102819 [Rhizobium tibeticum]|uniref:Uncharacterized protein n=1 Tax=Rhizobium tibeticum TaxID=501024 RepID=A0A1H8TBS5_9HYPH|nr:hypothetical protein RTCCBAU85039_5120 [Rhizobium tibeticum]SEO88265.1 hypothetical protein SAMN05216228_102819 [Rhizobium tibeticum]
MMTKDWRPLLSGDGYDQPPVGQCKAQPVGSAAMANGRKAVVVQEVKNRDSLFAFLFFVRLPSGRPVERYRTKPKAGPSHGRGRHRTLRFGASVAFATSPSRLAKR